MKIRDRSLMADVVIADLWVGTEMKRESDELEKGAQTCLDLAI